MNGTTILIPVDLGRQHFAGLEFVAALAAELPVAAAVLYVVPLNILPVERRVYDELCRENEERLKALACQFFRDQRPVVRARIGKAHEQILAEAEAMRAELIVMCGSEARVGRWRFRASTVQRVVSDATCLTLVLPKSWKITAEQYRRAMRREPFAGPFAAPQRDYSYQ
jgi:nucleotide-binding universal stress UspA family protein